MPRALAVSGRLFEMTPSDILTILASAFWPLFVFEVEGDALHAAV